MANLSVFAFGEQSIRTITDGENVLFLANDVCNILGYKNARRAVSTHCKAKGVTKRYTLTDGGKQEMVYIDEPNLYRLTTKSKLPDAEKFEEWVFEEVLPTIRKTGSYTATITSEQQYQIRQAVNNYAYRTGQHHQTIYNKFYNEFKIPRYQDLPISRFEEAMLFLDVNHQPKNILQVDIDLATLPQDNNAEIRALVEISLLSGRREVTLLKRNAQVVDPSNKDQVANLLQTMDCNLYPVALDVVIGYFKGINYLYHGKVCRNFGNN